MPTRLPRLWPSRADPARRSPAIARASVAGAIAAWLLDPAQVSRAEPPPSAVDDLAGSRCTLADTDGDGRYDLGEVSGDCNGDGFTNPKDIHVWAQQLTDTGPVTLLVHDGPYRATNGYASLAAWRADAEVSVYGLIEIPKDDFNLSCDPGVRIEGFTTPENPNVYYWSGIASLHKARPRITGCTIDLGYGTPYFASTWASSGTAFGIFAIGGTNPEIVGNHVRNTHHAGIYLRMVQNAEVADNTVEHFGSFSATANTVDDRVAASAAQGATRLVVGAGQGISYCDDDKDLDCDGLDAAPDTIFVHLANGDWQYLQVVSVAADTLTLAQPLRAPVNAGAIAFEPGSTPAAGIYFFSASGVDNVSPTGRRNHLRYGRNSAMHTRSDSSDAHVLDVEWLENTVEDVFGACLDVRSSHGLLAEWNVCTRTWGFDLRNYAANYCNEAPLDPNCAENVTLRDNQSLENLYNPNANSGPLFIGADTYIDGLTIERHLVDGSHPIQPCWSDHGTVRNLEAEVEVRNCGRQGYVVQAGAKAIDGAEIALTARDVGRSDFDDDRYPAVEFMAGSQPRRNMRLALTTIGQAGPAIRFNEGMISSSFELDASGIRSGFLGSYTEAQWATLACSNATESMWLLSSNASTATDVNPASGTGATGSGTLSIADSASCTPATADCVTGANFTTAGFAVNDPVLLTGFGGTTDGRYIVSAVSSTQLGLGTTALAAQSGSGDESVGENWNVRVGCQATGAANVWTALVERNSDAIRIAPGAGDSFTDNRFAGYVHDWGGGYGAVNLTPNATAVVDDVTFDLDTSNDDPASASTDMRGLVAASSLPLADITIPPAFTCEEAERGIVDCMDGSAESHATAGWGTYVSGESRVRSSDAPKGACKEGAQWHHLGVGLLLCDATLRWSQSRAVFDDFGDGSASEWSNYASTGATFDASSGAYQLSVTAGSPANPARATSARQGATESFTDILVSADLVDWSTATGLVYGVAARASSNATAPRNGYALYYTAGANRLSIARVDSETLTPLRWVSAPLDPAHDYRIVFDVRGPASNAQLAGWLYRTDGAKDLVATVQATDGSPYAAGFTGLMAADGSASANRSPQASFDHFFADTPNGDADNDGISNSAEASLARTDPWNRDTNEDGTLDGDEDADGDGLTHAAEISSLGTNPNDSDSDDDGFSDANEVAANTDPLDDDSYPGQGIVVDTTADDLTTNGNCSLREAIRAANLDVAVDGCNPGHGFDDIYLSAASYPLTIAGANEFHGLTGDLDVFTGMALHGVGAATTIIDATGLGDRVIDVRAPVEGADVALVLEDLTLRGGTATSYGSDTSLGGGLLIEQGSGSLGPVASVTLKDCVIELNSAESGGGIGIQPDGGAAIARSVIRSNMATGAGAGGIDSLGGMRLVDSTVAANAAAGAGAGGIASGNGFTDSPPSLRIRGSTIVGNESAGAGPGGILAAGTVSIVNATITGNTGGAGGGIATLDAGYGADVQLQFTTITDNAADDGGGIWMDGSVSVSVGASIVAGNTATGSGPDVFGSVISGDDNLIGDGSDASGFTGPGDQVGTTGSPVDPEIGALANNGGLTETHAPLLGSPAIGAADCVDGIMQDQRRSLRPVGARCDAGAVELPESGSAPGLGAGLALLCLLFRRRTRRESDRK